MNYPIIDIHCHPFSEPGHNSGLYHYSALKNPDDFKNGLKKAGIETFCGSVIVSNPDADMAFLKKCNREAMELKKIYGDRYIPGAHIHPEYGAESRREIRELYEIGVRLIGELVPYMHGYDRYMQGEGAEIFELAQELGMVVNIHPTDADDMENLISSFPRMNVIIAHPGEKPDLKINIDLMKKYQNAHLDISGTGLFRDGLLRYTIDAVGSERILFATDYPICNPAMQVGGVMYENLTEREREDIFFRNARRLLELDDL